MKEKEVPSKRNSHKQDTILFMSTFPPRECGIATFTKDLTSAIDKRISPKLKTKILALNSNGINIYNYPKKVVLQQSDNDINAYIETAKKINSSPEIKLVCIQHEFGIFGGDTGDHLLAFLEVLDKPTVITFHSIIPNPDNRLKTIVKAISKRVKEIVVMTPTAQDILHKQYNIDTSISLVPHGIPSVSLETQEKEKRKLGIQDKIILSSFGMINSGKGYEYVISSLPEVIKKFPNLLYLIVGETHPVVRKKEGEAYRNLLDEKVKSLGLQNHVKFYNKYVTIDEIIKYLKATDIYISSSLDPNQITSGTLSYAMGSGRFVISTPFLHAKDAITPETGVLVDFEKPSSFSKEIISILENPDKKKMIEKETYHKTRHMTWPNVALSYEKIFRKYLDVKDPYSIKLPKINLSHLVKLTDNFGMIQFANQIRPDLNSGYTLDDNARALLVCTMHYEKFRQFKQLNLIKTYLNFINYVQDKKGNLFNYVDKNKNIDSTNFSEDAHGRAIYALGFLISSPTIPIDFKKQAESILNKSLEVTNKFKSPRSLAFIINGICLYNKKRNSQNLKRYISRFANTLASMYDANSHNNWQWFEPYLTYANSKLPEALLHAYLNTKNKKYLKIALDSLDFLISKTFQENMFAPIGQKGWYVKDKEKAIYDQQPIEAAYTIQTLILAHNLTQKEKYRASAISAFEWFTGKNLLNQVIYNETTGGCYDGLGSSTINLNQGAESTLSYLIARLSLTDL
jgi:glycosyltransferase involved in cell wall biosynthesis